MAELSVPALDFSVLGNLGKDYRDARARMTLADLGKGLANGSIDYRTAAGRIADTGDINATYKFLQLAEDRRKQDQEAKASEDFTRSIGAYYGNEGVPATVRPGAIPPTTEGIRPSATPRSAAPALSLSNLAPAGPPVATDHPPVPSSATTWGDDEAVAAGLYDPPARQASHSVTPADQPVRVAQAQAPSAPQAAAGGQRTPPIGVLVQAASNPRLPQAQRDLAKSLLTSALEEAKATPDQKEYAFYRAQGGTDDFTTWMRGNKAAGRTQVTVDQRGETEEAKAAGKAAGERRGAMFAAAGAAPKTLSNLSRVQGLLAQVSQGKMQPERMTVSAWAKALGVNDDVATALGLDPKGVGSAQALQSLINESVVSKIGAGGFPANNFSDADREFLISIFPRIGNDPRANKVLVETARRVAQLDIDRAKAYQEFRRDPANKGSNFEDFELAWAEDMSRRDMFGDLRREAEGILGPPRNDVGGTIQNPEPAPAPARPSGTTRGGFKWSVQ